MKDILAALGLPENATAAQAVEAIEALNLQLKGLPKDIDPKALAEKTALGLDRDTAIQVMRSQAAEDAARTSSKPKSK